MAFGKKLNGTLRRFIERQPVFFVATAADTGRVNLSPKGTESLRILDDNRVLWLNLSGSGNETAGHIQVQNRITLMFCAFDSDPLILRLYGTARAIHPRDAEWDELIGQFPKMAGSRQIFDVSIDALNTSCGSGVPVMNFERDRVPDDLLPFFDDLGQDGVTDFWKRKNTETIDGFDTKLFED